MIFFLVLFNCNFSTYLGDPGQAGVNILHYSQIKYLGKVSIFLVFWGRVSSFFANSNEKYELSCGFYGLRVTFGEEFVSSLWEKFLWFL